tara:strand:- start:1010 stop:2332 length:1323 start_codon:yes stop_codon:yes gene_type:complete
MATKYYSREVARRSQANLYHDRQMAADRAADERYEQAKVERNIGYGTTAAKIGMDARDYGIDKQLGKTIDIESQMQYKDPTTGELVGATDPISGNPLMTTKEMNLYKSGANPDAGFFENIKEGMWTPEPTVDYKTMSKMSEDQIFSNYADTDFAREYSTRTRSLESAVSGDKKTLFESIGSGEKVEMKGGSTFKKYEGGEIVYDSSKESTATFNKPFSLKEGRGDTTFDFAEGSLDNQTRSRYFEAATEVKDGKVFAKEGFEGSFGLDKPGEIGSMTDDVFTPTSETLSFDLGAEASKSLTKEFAAADLATESGIAEDISSKIIEKGSLKAAEGGSKLLETAGKVGKVAGKVAGWYGVAKGAHQAFTAESDEDKAAGAAQAVGSALMMYGPDPISKGVGLVLSVGGGLFGGGGGGRDKSQDFAARNPSDNVLKGLSDRMA